MTSIPRTDDASTLRRAFKLAPTIVVDVPHRYGPTHAACSAGGRTSAIRQKLAKVRRLLDDIERLRTAK